MPSLLFFLRRFVARLNSAVSNALFSIEESLVKAEAESLGCLYVGAQYGARRRKGGERNMEFFLVTDPQNMSTFAVKPCERVAERLINHRRKF